MTKSSVLAVSAAIAFVAAAAAAENSAADVRDSMQGDINPAVMSIWEVTNEALSEEGGIDPALVDDAGWAQIAAGADGLAAAAQSLSEASSYVAAAPDNVSVGAGEVQMAEIQKHLDSDPQTFARMAAGLADHARKLAAAARTKDAEAAGQLVAELDGVCAECHARYWYPQ